MRINRKIRDYIEHELRHYHITKKELEQMRSCILDETACGDVSGIRGSGTSDSTAQRAMKLMSNVRIKKMEETLRAIDMVLEELDEEKYKLIEIAYWERPRTLNDTGIARKLSVGKTTYYRWKDAILFRIAQEMGLS